MYDHERVPTIDDISSDDYRFVEKNTDETSYVQLMGETPWNGTVFQYGNLRMITPEGDDETATMAFTYRIIDSALKSEVLEVDSAFKNYIGAVLQHIITDALETGEYKLGTDDDSNNDTKEPASQ